MNNNIYASSLVPNNVIPMNEHYMCYVCYMSETEQDCVPFQ